MAMEMQTMRNEQIHFTTRVLGPAAGYKLENHQITQTLRSKNESITHGILLGRVSPGDRLQVLLNSVVVGMAKFVSMDKVTWEALGTRDARRGRI